MIIAVASALVATSYSIGAELHHAAGRGGPGKRFPKVPRAYEGIDVIDGVFGRRSAQQGKKSKRANVGLIMAAGMGTKIGAGKNQEVGQRRDAYSPCLAASR